MATVTQVNVVHSLVTAIWAEDSEIRYEAWRKFSADPTTASTALGTLLAVLGNSSKATQDEVVKRLWAITK